MGENILHVLARCLSSVNKGVLFVGADGKSYYAYRGLDGRIRVNFEGVNAHGADDWFTGWIVTDSEYRCVLYHLLGVGNPEGNDAPR